MRLADVVGQQELKRHLIQSVDAGRVSQIVDIVAGDTFGQVFITDTNRGHIDDILREHASDYKIFNVDDGEVK